MIVTQSQVYQSALDDFSPFCSVIHLKASILAVGILKKLFSQGCLDRL